jgi:hypothetical protein
MVKKASAKQVATKEKTRVLINGSVAEFAGKKAVENAATWKSPKAGLSHSAWKSRKKRRDFHFSHRPGHDGNLFDYLYYSLHHSSWCICLV